MNQSWINIDKLGALGSEPDLMPPHREPNSLDVGMNVRAIGPNLGNAGGYLLVADLPEISAACINDTFTDANGTKISDHTPEAGSWAEWNVTLSDMLIQGNRLESAIDQSGIEYFNSAEASCVCDASKTVEIKFTGETGAGSSVYVMAFWNGEPGYGSDPTGVGVWLFGASIYFGKFPTDGVDGVGEVGAFDYTMTIVGDNATLIGTSGSTPINLSISISDYAANTSLGIVPNSYDAVYFDTFSASVS